MWKKERLAKELKKLFSGAVLLAALGTGILFTRPVQANPVKAVVPVNTTVKKYDITGDGKRDKIVIKTIASTDEDDTCSALFVSVNGKRAYEISDTRFFADVNAEIYTLANGQPFLYLNTCNEGDMGPVCALLRYDESGKFEKALDFQTIMADFGSDQAGRVTQVNGNNIVIREEIVSYSLGINTIQFTYKYSKGNFVPASRFGTYESIYVGRRNTRYLYANKIIPVYKASGSSALLYDLIKGGRVKIGRCALVKGKMYIEVTYKGRVGWIQALTEFPGEEEQQFANINYAG